MDTSLSDNEVLVLALIPATITMFGTLTLMYGEDKQWRSRDSVPSREKKIRMP